MVGVIRPSLSTPPTCYSMRGHHALSGPPAGCGFQCWAGKPVGERDSDRDAARHHLPMVAKYRAMRTTGAVFQLPHSHPHGAPSAVGDVIVSAAVGGLSIIMSNIQTIVCSDGCWSLAGCCCCRRRHHSRHLCPYRLQRLPRPPMSRPGRRPGRRSAAWSRWVVRTD